MRSAGIVENLKQDRLNCVYGDQLPNRTRISSESSGRASALFRLPEVRVPSRETEMAQPTGTEPVHDLGSDGLILVNGSAKLALACSVEGDLVKLRKDCKRLKEARPTVETVTIGERWPRSEATEEFGDEFWLTHILGRNGAGANNET